MKHIPKQSWIYRGRVIATCIVASLLVIISVGYVRSVSALSDCPCHIFTPAQVPSSPFVANDATPLSVGTRFIVATDGYVTGVRFYKDATMTDTHTGSLWTYGGSLLATGTYSGETGSGWQTLTFTTPVQVTAGSTYVATMFTPTGKYIASGNYFLNPLTNYPLTAPGSADSRGPAGVFVYGGDQYPSSTFNNGNYWVDVTYRQTTAGAPPAVASTAPTTGATNAYIGTSITATMNQNLDPDSVSSATVKLTDSTNADVPATVSYNDATKSIKIDPTSALSTHATYSVSLRGGTGGIENLDGTVMSANHQWSFTTGGDDCPCSIWNKGDLTDNPTTFAGTPGGEVLGQKIHANGNGYIHAVRFYKSIRTTATTHAVHIWTTTGTLLASGTSSNETDYGWQEVQLASPVAVSQGQDYVVSYYTPDNVHIYSDGALTAEAGSGPIRANAAGALYEPGGNDVFPTKNDGTNAVANFWIDVVFSATNSYTAPFTMDSSQPVSGSYGVLATKPLTFKMSNPVDPSTLASGVSVKTATGATIPGTAIYNSSLGTIVFTPSSPFARSTGYVVTLTSQLKDMYGTAHTPSTVSFTTGSAVVTTINQGMSGPVLVVTSASNPYSTYLAEMLRAQGISYFDVNDISELSAATLAHYSLVLLGKTTLSADNVSVLSSWVTNGGNLIAMQPDKQLASLLGITDQAATVSEGYLRVDTTQDPGKGITAQTMQYHYVADKYTTGSDTQTVATLYTDATTPTTSPAVTSRLVGSGHAVAFTYDLPRSIATTHQGNPAWAGQDRDGNAPVRPNDMFNGNGGTDWLNVAKAYIPQADEQQRLLTNIMQTISKDNAPLPQFWILPHGYKTALIMTEDDHGSTSSTYDIFDHFMLNSRTNCSVDDWGCERGGSLLYTSSGLTSTQATRLYGLGFDMGLHVNATCGNYTDYNSLNGTYITQLGAFRAKYADIPNQRTGRMHCYLWSDWDSVVKASFANGIRYDLTYEWFPNTWTGSHAGYLSGSGMTMRFTDSNGALLDVYQGVTDLDYETDPTSADVDSMLDNALNSNEFYGVLGTHYDTDDPYYRILLDSARSRNVPVISTDQMLTWKDAIGSSTFADMTSTKYKLSFRTQVAEGGQGMQAMVPTATSNGALTGITGAMAGSVSYTLTTVKGIQYAVFDAQPDTYVALYGMQPSGEVPVVVPPHAPVTEPVVTTNPVVSHATITTPDPFVEEPQPETQSPSITKTPIKTQGSSPITQSPAPAKQDIQPQLWDLPHITLYVGGLVAVLGVIGWLLFGLRKPSI